MRVNIYVGQAHFQALTICAGLRVVPWSQLHSAVSSDTQNNLSHPGEDRGVLGAVELL